MSDLAVGYVRLSQQSDTSLDRQRRHIREYTDDRDWVLDEIYDDGEGASGFDATREEYQSLRSRITTDDDLVVVVVNDKRRLARDIDDVMRLIPDLRQADVELHTHQDGRLDLSDPMRAAIEILQAAAAYEEKMEEIEKSIEAVEERQEKGYDQGRPRYGMKYGPDGKYQVPGDNFDTVREVWDLREDGCTYTEIAERTEVAVSTAQRIVTDREWYEERLERSRRPDSAGPFAQKVS